MDQKNRELVILALNRTNNWDWVGSGCDFNDYKPYHKILWEINKFMDEGDDGHWIDYELTELYFQESV
jgi:hypothetical protein